MYSNIVPDVASAVKPAVIPAVGYSGGYDPAASALFSRMTTPPTPARAALINALIVALKAAGIWNKLDTLWITAAANSQAAGLNWISTSYTLTPVNSPTFTADRGYASDGATSYLNTNATPNALSKYVLNSAHVGVYINTTIGFNGSVVDAGCSDATSRLQVDVWDAATSLKTRINHATLTVLSTISTDIGHTVVNRASSANFSGFKNGLALSTSVTASVALCTFPLFLGASNDTGVAAGFSTRRIACAHLGSSLTLAEDAAMYSALLTYLNAVGAA